MSTAAWCGEGRSLRPGVWGGLRVATVALASVCGCGRAGTSSVGAAAAPKEATMAEAFRVGEAHQERLLKVAREAIGHFLEHGREKAFEAVEPELNAPAAVFVTLTQNKRLRGCIGTLEPRMPLVRAVATYAVAAAVHDGRFPRLTPAELGRTHIEISVLSPMTVVKSADEIRPGVHGVVVRRGGRSGLFLPQVWEHFAKKEDFLDELCMQKAGLESGAWKDPKTELRVFTVFAFQEP